MKRFQDVRAVTSGDQQHFFGYYDKCPWNASGKYLLGLETDFMDRPPTGDDRAVVGMVDLEDNCQWAPLADTRAWCWQQGCMLRWLPSVSNRLIIYNDRDEDHYVSIIRDVLTEETQILPMPVYAVSNDGRQAVTLNFARVQRTRPGYGYAGVVDQWANDPHPEEDGIYWMDLKTGVYKLIVSLAQIAAFLPDDTMSIGHHWFNHLQFCADDRRFLFLHRWDIGEGRRRTRLFTANLDGSDLYCVSDHEMVSHFDWYDANHILAWARRYDVGDRYFLFTDQSDEVAVVGDGVLTVDGHCSYSPDRRWMLTDTYPDRDNHYRTLLLYRLKDGLRVDIGSFYSPPEVTGELRCDLHPRWHWNGTQVCVDSVHEGSRQMYVVDVSEVVAD